MINQNLHRQPTALDSVKHRQLRLKLPVTDWSVADRLNAIFVAAAEFGDVCREFPIVFVRAGRLYVLDTATGSVVRQLTDDPSIDGLAAYGPFP